MLVFLANLAATLFLTGLAWSLQLVQLRVLKSDQLPLHRQLNSRLMIGPMAIEFATAVLLAIKQPRALTIAALIFWLPVGYATLRYSLLHRDPDREAIMRRMKRWNIVRTLAWTVRSAILLWIAGASRGI